MRRLTLKTRTGSFEYTITHRPRVTKRLHMELDEQGELVVVAPRHWSKKYIRTTLSQNTSRIEHFLVRARQRQLEPLLYENGELHFYLGESYPLAVLPGLGRKTGVELSGNEIRININRHDPEGIRIALQTWYREQALKIFSGRLQIIAGRADWVGDRSVPLKLRRMKRTWGNCSSGGVIKLNTHLIKAPLLIIDSVIAHELCHLKEMNHSKAFYALLERLNPHWRQNRAWLRSEGNAYLL
ncbi:MAG: SprT family zinc-dependent metalloprotease [Xanthomonadales bacterium]|nr:SprT family zinc-dependent metalloprotease [Xanthomonadales bacterium]